MFDRRAMGVGCVMALVACGSPVAPPALDAATSDVGIDAAASDAGCTLAPGELPGTRRIAPAGLLPNLTFATEEGTVSLVDFHVPCAPAAELLVLRAVAAWSGHSRWQLAHTGALDALVERPRLRVIDLLVEGPDALPARLADLAALRALYDAPADVLAIDPDETFVDFGLSGTRLPLVVIVDARTLGVVRVLFAPHAGEVEHAIARALAVLDGRALPPPLVPMLFDGRFTTDEWDLVRGMASSALPPDPSNAHADDPAAASLGAALFADPGLSPSGIACASCHDETRGFGDGLPVGHGVADVTRNTPTLYAAAYVRWPFWDGRVDSLWAQALGPIENAREMASSRLFVAHRIAAMHRAGFEAVFGALGDLSDTARFPPAGAPGDAAWEAMSAVDQATITRVLTDAGKALEAYERTIATPRTRFDDYLAGDLEALTPTERDGLHEYLLEGCADCHWGPAMSDSAFHAVGMPGSGEGASLDHGRITALAALTSSPFRRQGSSSDAPSTPDPLAGLGSLDASAEGAFRTPTLRGLTATAPYGHAGTFASLRDVVRHYATLRMPRPADPRVAGGLDAHVGGFDDVPMRVDPLTAFLTTL